MLEGAPVDAGRKCFAVWAQVPIHVRFGFASLRRMRVVSRTIVFVVQLG